MRKKLLSLTVFMILIFLMTACGGKSEEGTTAATTYKLDFDITFDGNILFDKYDVYLLIDQKKEATLSHGEDLSTTVELEKGTHEITFEEKDGEGKYSREIELNEDSTFNCTIKTHSDSIEVMNLEINGIFVEDEATTEAATEATTEAITEATTETATEAITEAATEAVTEAATEAATEAPEDEIITKKNNKDFKKLIKVSDPGDPFVEEFASKYYGRTIEFDGAIYAMEHHGNYNTRFDVLINPCKYDEDSCSGPDFHFTDVNYYDMNITNSDSIEPYKNYHFVCEVGSYDSNSQLFELKPISMELKED